MLGLRWLKRCYSPITLTNRAVIQPNSHTLYAYNVQYTTKLHTCTTNYLSLPPPTQLNFEQQYVLISTIWLVSSSRKKKTAYTFYIIECYTTVRKNYADEELYRYLFVDQNQEPRTISVWCRLYSMYDTRQYRVVGLEIAGSARTRNQHVYESSSFIHHHLS